MGGMAGTAPTVVQVAPTAEATEVSIDTEVVIEFSQAMNVTSVEQGVTLNGPEGAVTATVLLSNGDTVATLTPSEPLVEFETAYSVQFGDAIVDSAGVSLEAQGAVNFTTAIVDPGYFYRLTTSFLGADQVLDTFSGNFGCHFADVNANTSGSFWRFEPDANTSGFYAVSNAFQPDLYLEGSDGTATCLLAAPSTPKPSLVVFTGQQWKFVRVEGHVTGCGPPVAGFFFLQNAFRGDGEALDTVTMNAIGCFTGQYWLPVRAGRI
jgi:hypothetical protein